MKTRTGIVILLIAMVCTLSLAAPAVASITLNNYEKQLITQVNKQRAKYGLSQLRLNGRLVSSARVHSADMGVRKYFAHDAPAPNAEEWAARIIRCGYTKKGYSYWKAGENIYYGSGIWSSPVAVVDGWMKSRTHRAVILTRVFRDIGVGAVKTEDGYGNLDGSVWFFTLDLGRRIAQ
jgi:uncharacterized protein YkwD